MSTSEPKVIKGGEFIVADTPFVDIFIPEEMTEEQIMIKSSVKGFVDSEIKNYGSKIEYQTKLMDEAAELGLLGSHIVEKYGGNPLDYYSNTIILEEMGKGDASFNTTFAAHTGIGMLPIYYFGSESIKLKYLPKLCKGTYKAAYCLTEPGSGSDALSAKTTAILNQEKTHYIINGQKMWITNAGFADLLIVFAQVNNSEFTGFLVERNTSGISMGEEENKLGIKGSSTRQVFFENVAVPIENVLGEIGKGHLIAFNVLNIGRFKLGALTMGGCKACIDIAVKYANDRIQFSQNISSFGAIQYKIAESLIRTFASESAVYRIADLLEDKYREEIAKSNSESIALLKSAEEYSIECAIIKVYSSETLSYVVDELLQIHGGYGYSEEYLPARLYRDSRINRIYEGTNEINRMLMINMLIKRAMKGTLDLVGPAWEVQKELTVMADNSIPDNAFGLEQRTIKDFKKIGLMVAGAAVKYQIDGKHDLKEQQEILMNIADILIDIFICESVLLRIQKLSIKLNEQEIKDYSSILKVIIYDAQFRISKAAQDALNSFAEGDELKIMLMGIKRFTRFPSVNIKSLRRQIAKRTIDANEYVY
ncbi:MAG: acyl-CoA dehydrogenase family protein [Saprospiraceae bacterium]|nr:acyl-CoA dehydrogenase family protein [Saprospiraceae bacterium]